MESLMDKIMLVIFVFVLSITALELYQIKKNVSTIKNHIERWVQLESVVED